MRRWLRRLAVMACLALMGGGAYWYFDQGQTSQQKQKQGQQKGFRREVCP
jgi:uncharacterized membrane protein YebE (DUF533 family)